jgi:hypothetical protein
MFPEIGTDAGDQVGGDMMPVVWHGAESPHRLRIGKLLDEFSAAECANYLANSGYAAT